MEIRFGNNKIKKACKSPSPKLQRRLDDLRAVANLKDAQFLPGRCHQLKSDRSGQFSIDLDHPNRLIFEAANEPLPVDKDGHWDLEKVTEIILIEVVDYHG